MQTLRQQHDNLEHETALRFSSLLKERENDLVLISEDEEDFENCEMVYIYNDIDGSTYSIYVVGITTGGLIEGVDVNDEGVRGDYRLSDLASLLDRINIVEVLEYNINN